MKPLRKSVAAATMAGALLTGGAAGALLFGPHVAGAQTTTTAPDSPDTAGGSTFRSNEDSTHEGAESADREAAEDSGTFHGGHGHGSNEDASHEQSESPEREAQEDARAATTTTVP